MAIADTRGNIVGGGIQNIYLKAITDAGYYNLPFIGNATFELNPVMTGQPDYKGRQYQIGFEAVVKCRCMTTNMTAMIKLMDTFCSSYNFLIQVLNKNATKFYSEDISATTGYFGVDLELVASGDFTNERYVDFTFTRKCTAAEVALATAGATGLGSPTGTDALDVLADLVRADIVPGTFTRFQFREGASSTWDDNLINIRNCNFRAKTVGPVDSLGRQLPHSIALEFSLECMQANSTEVLLLDNYAVREQDYQISFGDCYVTLNDKAGNEISWMVSPLMSDHAYLLFKGNGVVKSSEWDAMWTTGSP